MIKECKNCVDHKFQDTKYGKGKRVHTPNGTCTVCGKAGGVMNKKKR